MKNLNIGGLQIELPIIQGGLGVGISLSGLATAVANEGGVGVISPAGIGFLYKDHSSDYLENCIYGLTEEIRKTREKTRFLFCREWSSWIEEGIGIPQKKFCFRVR